MRSSRRPARDCASAVRAPGRFASCAGVAAKVARRSLTICQGGSSAGKPVSAATSRQIVCAQAPRAACRSAGRAPLIVTDSAVRESEHPFDRAVDHAERSAAAPAAAAMRKCALTMARNSSGALEAGHQIAAPPRAASASTTASSSPSGIVVAVETRAHRTRPPSKRSAAADARNATRAPRAARKASAGSTKRRSEPSRAISGRQARPPRAKRLAHERAGERAPSPRGGSVLSAASRKRRDQPLIQRPVAGHDLADASRRRARDQQARQRQIVERRGSGHAPRGVENPPRQRPVVEAQRPALAAREIDESRNPRRSGPASGRRRADRVRR